TSVRPDISRPRTQCILFPYTTLFRSAKAAAGVEQNSLDALRKASKTSWFKADDALWVKLVSTGYKRGSNPGAAETLQVSRDEKRSEERRVGKDRIPLRYEEDQIANEL